MSQTASGFLRLALLLIATASLALVWAGDQQAQQQFVIARKAASQRTQSTLLAQDVGPAHATFHLTPSRSKQNRTAADIHSIRTVRTTSPPADNSYVARVEIELSLPVGIAPGRYQVVDQTGSVRTIRVRSTLGPCKRQEIYSLIRPDGSREFFIRLGELAAASDDAHTR